MRYHQPFDQPGNLDASYVNANPDLGQRGSILDIIAVEQVQREIIKVVVEAGITPSDADLTQLWQAIRSIAGVVAQNIINQVLIDASVSVGIPFGVQSGGTSTSIIATFSPDPGGLRTGLLLVLKMGATANAGPAQLNANSYGLFDIVRTTGTPLSPNDLPANGIAILVFDGAKYQLISVMASSGGAGLSFGLCQLRKVGSSLVLLPKNGSSIFINGQFVAIPPAGVALSLVPSASTFFYIYAYLSTGVLTLEASGTGHATDATNGNEIKSGDPTRVLVGAIISGPSSEIVDDTARRWVASYYNRRTRRAQLDYGPCSTTSNGSTPMSGATIAFLVWGDENEITCTMQGYGQWPFANPYDPTLFWQAALDGSGMTPYASQSTHGPGPTSPTSANAHLRAYAAPAEGAHQLQGYHNTAGGNVPTLTSYCVMMVDLRI